MKRLLWYLNQISDGSTKTFRYSVKENEKIVQKEIYDGECVEIRLKPNGEPTGDREYIRREPAYWQNGISYTFDRTNRLSPDRPTVTAAIPAERLGICASDMTVAAADYCLRRIKPYFHEFRSSHANCTVCSKSAFASSWIKYQPSTKISSASPALCSLAPGRAISERAIEYASSWL